MLRENGRNSEGYVCPLLTRLRQPGDHSGVRQRSPDDQFDRRCIVTDLETMLALSVIQNEMMKVADNLPGDASKIVVYASKILGLVKNASSDRSGEATADKHTVDLSVGVVDVRRTVVLEKLSFLQIEGKGVHRATGLQDLGEHPPRGR